MDVDDENKVDKNETNDKPKTKGKGASSGKSRDLLKKQWHQVPVVLVGIIGIAILIAAVAGLFISFGSGGDSNEPSVTLDSMYKESELTYKERADRMAYYGNYDEAQWTLDEGIEGSKNDPTSQGNFYQEKTFIALNAGEYEQALEFAMQGEKLNPTVQSAALVAEAAEASGESFLAIEHYSLAADRTPEEEKDPDSVNTEYSYFLFRIRELGGVYED